MSESRSAPSADDRQSGPATPARRVISGRIEQRPAVWLEAEQPSDDTSPAPPSDELGSIAGAGSRKAKIQTSPQPTGPSGKPIFDSDGHWDTPDDLLALAGQANKLATQILNGEANLAVAREYARVTATIASLLRTEIERRRFVGGDPIRFPR